VVDLKTQERIWEHEDNAKHYWDYHSQRSKWFASKIDQSVKSVFEVGCNSGRNLRFILDARPDIKVGGVDINQKAIDLAIKNIPEGEFTWDSIYNNNWVAEKYDLVFTSGVLLHIVPEKIEELIANIVNKSNRFVMHMETVGDGSILKENSGDGNKLYWFPDIKSIYNKLGYNPDIINSPCGGQDASNLVTLDLLQKQGSYSFDNSAGKISNWLHEISYRCSASRAGPWTYVKNSDGKYDVYIDNGRFDAKVCTVENEADADFIAHSPNDIRVLALVGKTWLDSTK
jgi:SAM-dependent methyltransferase